MSETGRIAKLFGRLDGERRDALDMARRCARLCKPYLLPDDEFMTKNAQRRARGEDEVPQNFQSLGARSLGSLKGHFLQNGFPTEAPWVALELPAQWLYNPQIPDDWKVQAQNRLFMAQLTMMGILESAPIDPDTKQASLRNSMGFRAALSRVIDSSAGLGDALLFMRDDYRMRTYRLDWYVTKRDTSNDVLCHAVKEMKDPLDLSETQFAKTNLKMKDLEKKDATERQTEIFTYCEWQPRAKNWLLQQEMNGNIINEYDEPISPFISAPFEIVDGDDSGHGFIETNYGDFSTFDRIEEGYIDYGAMVSKMHPIVDPSSLVRDRDFMARTGTPIRNVRVVGGVAQDVGFLKIDKMGDFGALQVVRDAKRKDLGAAALLESEAAPTGEAGRHSTGWKMVYGELQRVTGGLYATFVENLQLHIVRRAIYQMQRDGLIEKFNLGNVRIRVLTGLAAMERDAKKQKLLSFAQFVQALGPEAQARIDPQVAVDVWSRYDNFYEPGLMKTDERVKQEMAMAAQAQAKLAAQEKAVDVIGNVAEANLLPASAA